MVGSQNLNVITTDQLHARNAEQFIRELAHQAILRDDSMMAREVGYHGFGSAPLLSDSLFTERFILQRYNPFNSFFGFYSEAVSAQMLRRFNSAAERCYTSLIAGGSRGRVQAAYSIAALYRTAFMRASTIQGADERDTGLVVEMDNAVMLAMKMANQLLATLDPHHYRLLYVDDPKAHRDDVLETLVEIVYEALTAISNRFKGMDDAFWFMAIQIFQKGYSPFEEQPEGMTPFQQRLALKIVDKLRDNMRGFYPATSRVLIVCVGPFESQVKPRTAFNILKDAIYFELQNFPELAKAQPDRFKSYLPEHISYDVEGENLVYTYRNGQQVVTKLSALNLPPISLEARHIHQKGVSA